MIKFLALSLTLTLPAVASAELASPRDGFVSKKPASKWVEALVSGNGVMGLMVYGTPRDERVIFNHELFYEPLRNEVVKAPKIAHEMPEFRKLQREGKYDEAMKFFWAACNRAGHKEIVWTEPYHPGYAMTIKGGGKGAVADYERSCNFLNGEIRVQWSDDDGQHLQRSFVSRKEEVIVQELVAPEGAVGSWTLNLEAQGRKKEAFVSDPYVELEEGWMTYRMGYSKTDGGFEGITRVIAEGGTRKVTESGLVVTDAKRILLLTRLLRLDDYANCQAEPTKEALSKIKGNYEALLSEHAAIHGARYKRVSLNLGTSDEDHARSSEELLVAQKALPEGDIDMVLLEKMFNMGIYTLISSSGENPPNLMGIWNGEFRPMWSGDFTLDANVNLQIAAANLAGQEEAIASYASLFQKIRPDWEENAQRLYGCRGLLSNIRTSGADGHQYHHSAGFPGASWVAGTQWLTLPLIESYEATGDREFLSETVMPFLEGIALFYEDFLKERNAEGKLVFSPSYSPENHPLDQPPMVINATMDIAAAKEALGYVIKFSKELSRNAERIPVWEALIADLPDYRINKDGALAEWIPEELKDNYDHRHVSHLYPLWPGHEINPEQTPEWFAAAQVAATKRGRGNGSAHGLAHMALIATRTKDADLVAGNLAYMLTNDYILPSLFTYHNPGRIYNSDMLHSLPAVVMEMLVYSRPGEIELLPALSDKFSSGSVNGLHTRSQVTIESFAWDLKKGTMALRLLPKKTQTVTLRTRRGTGMSVAVDGESKSGTDAQSLPTYELELTEGRRVSLAIKIVGGN